MDYVTVRELRSESGKVWERLEAGEDIVVTRNGKPFALLVHTEPSTVDETLRALRLQAFSRAWKALSEQARASGAAEMSDEEIQAEIEAVRRKRHRAARRS